MLRTGLPMLLLAGQAGLALAAARAAQTALDAYLDDLRTLRASFVQTLVDARGKQIDRSSGVLIVVRPGRFSWEIHPQASQSDGGQLMVADGRNLWFLDRELQQVTVKPVDAALSATPAMLLSGSGDFRKNFNIAPAPPRDGLDWVLVSPQGTEADFRQALLGFQGKELKRMILEDKLGQTATVTFDHVERNVPISPEAVSFTPPAGVDVIGTPQK